MTPKRINILKGSTCVMYLVYNLVFVHVTSRVSRVIVVWSSFRILLAAGICIVVCVFGGEGLGMRGVELVAFREACFLLATPTCI